MDNLKEIVQLDLERAKGLIKQIYPSPIDPQFRLLTETGEFWLGITLSEDMGKRTEQIFMILQLMSAKKTLAYTMCAETNKPDGITSFGQSMFGGIKNLYGLQETINRTPLSFTNRKTLNDDQLEAYGSMLPLFSNTAVVVTDELEKELNKWFGNNGNFPLVPIIQKK